MASELVRFSIAIPAKLLDEFDEYTARRGLLVNRSEAIRNLIRDALVDSELDVYKRQVPNAPSPWRIESMMLDQSMPPPKPEPP